MVTPKYRPLLITAECKEQLGEVVATLGTLPERIFENPFQLSAGGDHISPRLGLGFKHPFHAPRLLSKYRKLRHNPK